MKVLVHVTFRQKGLQFDETFSTITLPRMAAYFKMEDLEHTRARWQRFGIFSVVMSEEKIVELAALPEVLAVERDGAKRPSDLREEG